MTRFACSLVLLLSSSVSLLADIPPPPPSMGYKRIPREFVVKLEKEVPDYKFYSFRQGISGSGSIEKELSLSTTNSVPVPGSSSPSVRTGVIAIPNHIVDELKTNENIAKLLDRDETEELPKKVVVHYTHGTNVDVVSSDTRSKVETVISVAPNELQGVTFVEQQPPEPESVKQSPFAMIMAGIAGSLAVIAFGVWYFRQKRST